MIDLSVEPCWMCRDRPATPGTTAASASAVASGLCVPCAGLTRPYDEAWERLSKYLLANWKDIVKRGSFDLSRVFGGEAAAAASRVQLYFVKLLGAKLIQENVNVDVTTLSGALRQGRAHAEITLLIADCATDGKTLLYYDSQVSVLKRDAEVHSAVWMTLLYPVAVKVCYLKSSAPVMEPEGFPWHPTRQRKVVKLSPYKGDTRPVHARRDLRL